MRHKKAKNCDIKPWLSANLDNTEGRYIQVGNTLLLSKQFQALSAGARYTYLCMTMEAGIGRSFTLPKKAAVKYGIPAATLRRHVDELISAGFIQKTSGANTKEPNIYSFEFGWKRAVK